MLSTAGDYVGEACLVRGGLLWSGTATATMELTCYKLSRSSFKSKFPLVDATTGVKDASVPPCLSVRLSPLGVGRALSNRHVAAPHGVVPE